MPCVSAHVVLTQVENAFPWATASRVPTLISDSPEGSHSCEDVAESFMRTKMYRHVSVKKPRCERLSKSTTPTFLRFYSCGYKPGVLKLNYSMTPQGSHISKDPS